MPGAYVPPPIWVRATWRVRGGRWLAERAVVDGGGVVGSQVRRGDGGHDEAHDHHEGGEGRRPAGELARRLVAPPGRGHRGRRPTEQRVPRLVPRRLQDLGLDQHALLLVDAPPHHLTKVGMGLERGQGHALGFAVGLRDVDVPPDPGIGDVPRDHLLGIARGPHGLPVDVHALPGDVVRLHVHEEGPASAPHLHHRFLNIGFSQRRAAVTMWLWCASLAGAALATRFVPFREGGDWHLWETILVLAIGFFAVAFSVYVVYLLEIVKLMNPRIRRREREQGEPAERISA